MDNLDPARKLAIISHMNEDHADACLLYARHFAKNCQATSAEMIDVSFSQITLRVSGEVITHSRRKTKHENNNLWRHCDSIMRRKL